ncbi:MAG: exodeoxyribonuclease VII small subunit [Clostridia bacterium]
MKDSINFEQAIKRLEEIVTKLSSGNLPLDEMVKLYEQGDALSKHCLELLDAYEARLDKIDGICAQEECKE